MSRYMVVGLGNPGKEYEKTRHNIGFMVADALAAAYSLSFSSKKAKAVYADGMIASERMMLVKPQSYMNNSGDPVRELVNFFNVDFNRLIVISDDLDIDLGTLRLRPKGGAGGQKGVKHIIQQLGTQEFARLRIGIGRPPGRMDASKYVLRRFADEDSILVQETIDRAGRAVEDWIRHGFDYAMNRHNGTAEEAAQRFADPPPPAE